MNDSWMPWEDPEVLARASDHVDHQHDDEYFGPFDADQAYQLQEELENSFVVRPRGRRQRRSHGLRPRHGRAVAHRPEDGEVTQPHRNGAEEKSMDQPLYQQFRGDLESLKEKKMGDQTSIRVSSNSSSRAAAGVLAAEASNSADELQALVETGVRPKVPDENLGAPDVSTGEPASAGLVEVYQILTYAEKPLTVSEIAAQMSDVFRSAAVRGFTEHKQKTDPTWLVGKGTPWGEACTTEAMTWWVQRVVQSGCDSEHFIPTTSQPGAYTTGQPPKVRRTTWAQRTVWVEQTAIVEWSPEDQAALNELQFLLSLRAYRDKGRHTARETRELLDLAERAIRKHNHG
jgi:hypothetical protein